MRLHRFYVYKPLGEELVVESGLREEKELLHQWTHVFRFKSGDEVFLFCKNTPGSDFLYRFSSLSKDQATLTPVSSTSNILPSEVTLVMALVKKDTFETVVRQATELGVTRIIPLLAGRSEKKNLNFERLSLISIEAAEQCGRGDVPTITQIASLEEAFALTEGCANVVGSLHGEKSSPLNREHVAIWVGPEGGWTEREENSMKERGFSLYKLTETVLKADTAAVALISAIQRDL